MAEKSAEVDPAEEEAVVYVMEVELAGKNVVGVDEMAMNWHAVLNSELS